MKKKIRKPKDFKGIRATVSIYKTAKLSHGIIIQEGRECIAMRRDLHKFAKWIGRVSAWVKQESIKK